MSIALWCVLAAGLLPYLAAGLAKGGTRFDNRTPRAWLAAQTGWRARANAAQQNGFEAFPLFAIAVLVATLHGAAGHRVDMLALLFIGARVLYLAAYVAGFATLRSLVWMVGLGATVAIFISAT